MYKLEETKTYNRLPMGGDEEEKPKNGYYYKEISREEYERLNARQNTPKQDVIMSAVYWVSFSVPFLIVIVLLWLMIWK